MTFARKKILITTVLALAALAAVLLKYRHYIANPWTRDGQVRANVITVSPRVTGPIVRLPITDNQFVKAGDLLFEIDPRTFLSKLKEAQASLDQTIISLQVLDHQVTAAKEALRQAESRIRQAEFDIDSQDAQYVLAKKNYGRAATLVGEATISVQDYDTSRKTRDVTQATRAQARSALVQAQAAKSQAEAELARAVTARGPTGEDNPQLRAARAAVEDATLNYEFTKQRASVDGYVTNLNLRIGSQAVANLPALALVDVASYFIAGYFMETQIADVKAGQRAVITLMTYPDTPVPGVVESVGWGIFQPDGASGENLLPTVSPTFEWIRLAQRIPIRVRPLVPNEAIKLRVGATASVMIMTGEKPVDPASVPPVPAALQ
jgi:multidrug resistance efflux pump